MLHYRMTALHIFSLHSRLGLKNPPIGSTVLNQGVENGPEDLVEALPEDLLAAAHTDGFGFPMPDEIPSNTYLQETGLIYQDAKAAILEQWLPDEQALFLGGDHSISSISLAAVLERFGAGNVGVVMFDSHGDIHRPETSPSGNYHGMWLRSAFDQFPVAEIEALFPQKLQSDQYILVGNTLLEKEEDEYFDSLNVRRISTQSLQENAAGDFQYLQEFCQRFQHIHVSFDIDVFQGQLVPGTGTPNQKGLATNEVWPLVDEIVAATQEKTLSLDLVEFNPRRDVQQKTLNLSIEVIKKFIDSNVVMNYILSTV